MNLKFKHMDLISELYCHSLQSRLIAEYYGKKYPEHDVMNRVDMW